MAQTLVPLAFALPPVILERLDQEASRRTIQRGLLLRQLVLDFLARECPALETPPTESLAIATP